MESPCIIKMPRDGETPPRAHAAVKAPTASWFARESRKGRTFDLDRFRGGGGGGGGGARHVGLMANRYKHSIPRTLCYIL